MNLKVEKRIHKSETQVRQHLGLLKQKVMKVKVLKTCPPLTERGINVGEEYDVINEAPSEQRKGKHCYLIKGTKGTPIVVYDDEIEKHE